MLKTNGSIDKLVPYKPGKTIDEIKRIYGHKKIIKLASNENSFGTSPKAADAIRNFIEKANLYADGSCIELRSKIAETTGVHYDNITVGNGSNELIELLFRAYIQKGDNIVSCSPTFSFYKICSQTTFGEFIEVPLENYVFSLNNILKIINKNTKAVIICNPNNPTGTVIKNTEFQNFIEKMDRNILVVIDEAYFEFMSEKNKLNSVELIKKFPEKNIVILRTFSKIYGLSALRVGYGISNRKIADVLNKVRQPFNVNGFAQIAASAALDDSEFLNKTLQGIKEGKEYLYNEFEKLGIFYLQSEANFVFFKLNYDNDFIFEEFLKKGIIIRSLKSFGYKDALRVTVGTMKENEQFVKSLQEILSENK